MSKKKYLTEQSNERFDNAVSDFIGQIKIEGQKTIHDRLISRGLINENTYPLKTFYSDIRNACEYRTGILLKPDLLFAVMQVFDIPPSNIFRPQNSTNEPVYLHEKSIQRIVDVVKASKRSHSKKEMQSLYDVLTNTFQVYSAVNMLFLDNEIYALWVLFLNGSLKNPHYYPHGKNNKDLRSIDLTIPGIKFEVREAS